MTVTAEGLKTEQIRHELHIEELEDKILISPPIGTNYFNTIHILDYFNDYYKSKQVILHKSYAEITYVNDDGETAEAMYRKAGFTSNELINNELHLYNVVD